MVRQNLWWSILFCDFYFSCGLISKYCNKLIKHSLRQNMLEYGSEKPVFFHILRSVWNWLNDKILPDVYSEPSQTSEMELFVKMQNIHSELFLKIGVTTFLEKYLRKDLFFSKVAGYKPANLLKVNSLTGIFQGFC